MGTSTTDPARAPRPGARERVLAAADRLFYAEGVQTVGVDRIIDEAGVAKASLYRCFGSKDALIAAYLQNRQDAVLSRLRAAAAAADGPRARVLAIFESQAGVIRRAEYRGCPFAAASAESQRGDRVDAATAGYRQAVRDLLTEVVSELDVPEPARTARLLQLVFDGGNLAARLDRDSAIGDDLCTAAAVVLDAASHR